MIKNISKLVVGSALLLMSGLAVATNAQVPGNSILKANIPFSFVLRNKTFAPGKYTFRQTGSDADSEFALEILSDTGKERTLVFLTTGVTENKVPENSKLIFDKLGDNYFLSQIFIAGDVNGNQIEPSKIEKNLEKSNLVKEKYILKVGRWKMIEESEEKLVDGT